MLTTLAMVAALLLTPAGKTVVNVEEVTGQGTTTLAVGGTFSCTSKAVTRLVVTVNDRDTAFTHAAQVVEQISCPATDQAFRVELPAPDSVWWHRKLTVHADLRDPDAVRAATIAPVAEGTLLAVTVGAAELKGGNLVVSGTGIGMLGRQAGVTVKATQGDVHGEATIPLPATKSYAVPVHPNNAKVFLAWEPIDFAVTMEGATVSGSLTPSRP